jgi:hypothetical protein
LIIIGKFGRWRFLDFSNIKLKTGSKEKKPRKLKRQTKRNNRNIFGLLCFGKWK